MVTAAVLVIVVGCIALWIIASMLVAEAALRKGRSYWGLLLLGLLVSPILAAIVCLILEPAHA